MKKRYLALILACIMMSSLSLSACGRISDAIVSHDEDEDDEDDEDEEEDEPVYVDVLEGSDLKDQIKVLVDNREDWIFDPNVSAAVESFDYMVTDLDHNGRLEIITVIDFEYDGNTEAHIFEVDEKGKGLKEAKWKWKGLDLSSDKYPEFSTGAGFFYDKKKTVTGYEMNNYFDNGNGEFGYAAYEITYADGKITCYNYATAVMEDEWVFYTDDGTDIDDEEEFGDYLEEYHDEYKSKEIEFGIYSERQNVLEGIADFSDDALKDILTDSYNVFVGEMDFDEFDAQYNSAEDPSNSAAEFCEQIIGKWRLYSVEIDSDIEYFEQDSDDYIAIEIFDDLSAELTVGVSGDIVVDEFLPIIFEQGETASFYIPAIVLDNNGNVSLDDDIDHIAFRFMELSDDGQDLSVEAVAFDEDGYICERYDTVFIREKPGQTAGSYSIDRYVGEWELVSSEIEGDVTEYEPNGSFNATLIVDEDGNVSLLEYKNGKLELEIDEELKFDTLGLAYFEYSDEDALSAPIASEKYLLYLNMADYNVMDVYLDFYDEDGGWIGGCCLTFEKTYG